MNMLFSIGIGGWEMILILAVILMLFGAKKLPDLAKGLGTGIKEFKKATREVTDEIHNAVDDNNYSHLPPPRRAAEPTVAQNTAEAAQPAKPTPTPASPEQKS